MKKISLIAVAALITSISASASAATKEGFYVGVGGGAISGNHKFDATIYTNMQTGTAATETGGTVTAGPAKKSDAVALTDAKVKKQTLAFSTKKGAPVFGLGMGYDMGVFRAELDFRYLASSKLNLSEDVTLSFATSATNETVTATGKINSKSSFKGYGVNLNAFYDFENSSKLVPYIGAGIGWTKLTIDVESIAHTPGGTPTYGSVVEAGHTNIQFYNQNILGKKNKSMMTYGFCVGTSYEVSDGISLDLRLGAQHLNKITFDAPSDFEAITDGIPASSATLGKKGALVQTAIDIKKKAMWTMGGMAGLRVTF